MRLIADNMLGKLAKWLRFMGYDVLYPKVADDKELVNISRNEDRILLTRDKELVKIKDLNFIYINSAVLDEQLTQIINELKITTIKDSFTRCPECNMILEHVDKIEVKENVPAGVYQNQSEFWYCKDCNQYFWQGTHYTKIKNKLDKLLNK